MGSFSYTCAVSGLPIEAGDRVRYYLVTRNPYEDSTVCYSHDLWFPRVWPLRAAYNDYGSVESVESGPVQQAWLDGFQLDLVERGWGDNSCHDVSTFKDMSFATMLEAALEGRLLVHRLDLETSMRCQVVGSGRVPIARTTHQTEAYPEGVPTLARMRDIIITQGFEVFDGSHAPNKIMIDDDDGYGRIRMRVGDFGGSYEPLEVLEKALRDAGYACMLTRGTGSYASRAELLVRPLPSVSEYHYSSSSASSDRTHPVRQAMIREDVWQAMVAVPIERWDGSITTVADRRAAARRTWDAVVAERASTQTTDMGLALDSTHEDFLRDPIPFTVGLGTAFRLVSSYAEEMTPEQVDAFLDTVAEFTHIGDVMALSRCLWRPSYSNGPQFGEWALHERLLASFRDIAAETAERQRADDEMM